MNVQYSSSSVTFLLVLLLISTGNVRAACNHSLSFTELYMYLVSHQKYFIRNTITYCVLRSSIERTGRKEILICLLYLFTEVYLCVPNDELCYRSYSSLAQLTSK